MATVTNVQAENPVGADGAGGQILNVTNYRIYQVNSTLHNFAAPTEKYKNVATELGLTDVDDDAEQQGKGRKLAQGSGYIYLAVKLANGARLKVVCDPSSVGNALEKLPGKTMYDQDISRVYIPKKRQFI